MNQYGVPPSLRHRPPSCLHFKGLAQSCICSAFPGPLLYSGAPDTEADVYPGSPSIPALPTKAKQLALSQMSRAVLKTPRPDGGADQVRQEWGPLCTPPIKQGRSGDPFVHHPSSKAGVGTPLYTTHQGGLSLVQQSRLKGAAFTGASQVQIPARHLLTPWLSHLMVPQFPHLSNGGNNYSYLVACSREGDYICIMCLAHSKSSVNGVISY